MFKALKAIKKIKQLQKEMHDVSHVLKDVLDGKSVDEAMKRLNSEVKIEKAGQEDDQN